MRSNISTASLMARTSALLRALTSPSTHTGFLSRATGPGAAGNHHIVMKHEAVAASLPLGPDSNTVAPTVCDRHQASLPPVDQQRVIA